VNSEFDGFFGDVVVLVYRNKIKTLFIRAGKE
jgi:hypothetical protein